MKKETKIKWALWVSIFCGLAFTVLSIYYFIDIIQGNADRLIIISFVLYTISAGAWTVKAFADNKSLKELKKD